MTDSVRDSEIAQIMSTVVADEDIREEATIDAAKTAEPADAAIGGRYVVNGKTVDAHGRALT